MQSIRLVVPAIVFILAGVPAFAVPISFSALTSNDAGNVAIGLGAMSVDLTDNGSGSATLTITMSNSSVATAAVVKSVYIDTDFLADPPNIAFQSGGVGLVAFVVDSDAGNLPGGNSVSFETDESASANPPPTRNGIGWHNNDPTSGQSGIFTFDYTGSFADLLVDLSSGGIGVHMIGFGDDGSEAFVAVPEPTTALLVGIGLGALGLTRRRRKSAR